MQQNTLFLIENIQLKCWRSHLNVLKYWFYYCQLEFHQDKSIHCSFNNLICPLEYGQRRYEKIRRTMRKEGGRTTSTIFYVHKKEHHTYIPLIWHVLYWLPEHAPTKTEQFRSTVCDTHHEDPEEWANKN